MLKSVEMQRITDIKVLNRKDYNTVKLRVLHSLETFFFLILILIL